MSLSNSPHSYLPEYAVLDRALATPRGVRLPCNTYEAAVAYRHRLNHARAVDRLQSKTIYQEGQAGYMTSIYDALILKLKNIDGKVFVYVEHNRVPAMEDIPGDEGFAEIPDWTPIEPTLED